MERDKLVEQMLKEKGDTNNTIDLNAHARGIIDIYEKLNHLQIKMVELGGAGSEAGGKWAKFVSKLTETKLKIDAKE